MIHSIWKLLAHWPSGRSARQATDVRGRADYMFRQCTGRHPDEWELRELVQEYEKHHSTYQAKREAAVALTQVGEQPMPESIAEVDSLAAWTVIANMVLNMDEVVNKN